jgi:hypothetical protein
MGSYALIKNGIVENIVEWDGTGDIFSEYTTIEIDALEVGVGWTYDGEVFSAPPVPELTHDEQVSAAEIEKQALIDEANAWINGQQWPSKLALGRLSDDEKELFNEWLDYLDAVSVVDTSTAPGIEWPTPPDQPAS